MTAPIEITNSSLGTFDECQEKYRLQYVELLRPIRQADYFRFGGAYHLGHETFNKTGDMDKAIEAVITNYENPPEHVVDDEASLEKWKYEATTVIVLFQQYHRYYGAEQRRVVETESVFSVPVRNPETGRPTPLFVRKGRRDTIFQLADERFALNDYKTSSSDIAPGSDYQWMLQIDPQPSGYFAATIEEGKQLHTIIYDVTKKPTIRPESVPLMDEDGVKIVLDLAGERVRTKDGKKWRETGDAEKGYVLQSRKQTMGEWAEKLRKHIQVNPAAYFQRYEVTRTDKDLETYKRDLWNRSRLLAECYRNNRWYKNTRACVRFNQRCSFFNICTQRLPINPTPDGFERGGVMHEELED